ncbi:unnamed protein product [Pleuronectes platessa]|uniref:Uncharacterized protein n=1 Tax=Pleuronectes platessa TaxID=8262 RepID=A0A9N7TRE8_PLEPL|nr:unnamed protein product [Pleuronectes platessa]
MSQLPPHLQAVGCVELSIERTSRSEAPLPNLLYRSQGGGRTGLQQLSWTPIELTLWGTLQRSDTQPVPPPLGFFSAGIDPRQQEYPVQQNPSLPPVPVYELSARPSAPAASDARPRPGGGCPRSREEELELRELKLGQKGGERMLRNNLRPH